MENFTFYTPTRVHFGKGTIEQLHKETVAVGKKVLLVYGGNSIKRSGLYDTVKQKLSDCQIFDLPGVEPNPRVTSVREGARLCKEHNIDLVLAVGGGSVLDCAKAICAAACYDGDAWEQVLDWSKVTKALPLGTVLTLSATGSEFDAGAVISNLETNEKLAIISDLLNPRFSILDPQYTFTVPANQTAAGAADIMSHIYEQYFCAVTNPVSDGLCETILKTIIECAPLLIKEPENYDARANMMWASSLACNGICSLGNGIRPWPCHAMEHELSAIYDITHGVGLAILTPHLLRYALNETTVERYCHYGKAVFGMAEQDDRMAMANEAINRTEQFFTSLGIPNNLTALGIDDSRIDEMAEHCVKFNPGLDKFIRPLLLEDVKQIYRNAL
ncbi:iron-containing alcohol dehydrogenase [Anaerobiospirillum sp. NML120449]|uniref:iron-containing alcohol dehydrogenase n=1 Tax=Anaerobiospirillum sp. NML120449 TaxID=2932817 RepID=UPI001FF230EB|nr:iron-containing alcohol dehydrogenase [Anaerobiospirillum sp. NML120449]MCK0526774.1 iron-containing alcohol dehydrogenase [Anaerobiospirillum sp. NML120449]